MNRTENAILYINPKEEKSETRSDVSEYEWLKQLLENAVTGCGKIAGGKFLHDSYLGVHTCKCGARSRSYDFLFPNNMYTNSLCLHYLEWHRHEIPEEEFHKLELLKNNVQMKQCSKCKNYCNLGKYKRCSICRPGRKV